MQLTTESVVPSRKILGPAYLTVCQVAALLGVCGRTVRNWSGCTGRGNLAGFPRPVRFTDSPRGRLYYSRAEVESWAAQRESMRQAA